MRKMTVLLLLLLLVLVSCSPEQGLILYSDYNIKIRNNCSFPVEVNVRQEGQSSNGIYTVIDHSDLIVITQKDMGYIISYQMLGDDEHGAEISTTTTTQNTRLAFRWQDNQIICEITHE